MVEFENMCPEHESRNLWSESRSWSSMELVSHGAVSAGSWFPSMEGGICYCTYSGARNYLSTKVAPVNQTEQVKLCWCDGSCRCTWVAALWVGTRWSLLSLPNQTTLGRWPWHGRIQTQMSSNGPGKTEERRSFLGAGTPGWALLLTCSWGWWQLVWALTSAEWIEIISSHLGVSRNDWWWCRNGIPQFSTLIKKQSKTRSLPPRSGRQKAEVLG